MKKQLTDKDRDLLRKSLQKFHQSGIIIIYCLAIKESKTGISSNQRLLLLHSGEKSIRYYSKEPPNLPFTKLSEISQGKSKVMTDSANNFKCEKVKGKTSTMKIEWEEGKNVQTWLFTFNKASMMNQFVAAVEEMKAGTIAFDPTFIGDGFGQPAKTDNQNGEQPNQNQPATNSFNPQPVNQNGQASNQPTNNPPQSSQKPNQSTQPLAQQPPAQQPSAQQPPPAQQPPAQQPPAQQQQQPQKPPSQTSSQPAAQQNTQPAQNQSKLPAQQPPAQQPPAQQPPAQQPPAQQANQTSQNPSKPQSSIAPQENLSRPTSTQPQPQPQSQPQTQSSKLPQGQQPPPLNANSSTNQTKPQFNDFNQQLLALRQTNPQRFKLENQLSRKKLNQPQSDVPFILSETDNVDTKRQPQQQPPQSQPQPFTKKSVNQPYQSQQPSEPSQQPPPYQSQQQPPPPQSVQNSSTNPQWQSQASSNKPNYNTGQSIRKNGSNRELSDMNDPFDSSQQPMNRTHSQQNNLSQPQNSRAKPTSEYSYNPQPHSQPRSSPSPPSPKWNELWCTTSNPLQVYEQFCQFCKSASMHIIDELPLLKSNRKYHPIKKQPPYSLYIQNGILFNIHYFEDEQNIDTQRSQDQRAPLLFDHQSFEECKREFYNYNFVLQVTGNKGFVKVPLACLVQYKGILVLCRAQMPEFFQKLPTQLYQKYLGGLEDMLKMRFVFNSVALYMQPQKKYVLLSDLDQLIPRIPIDIHPPVYFRSQFLLQNNQILQNQHSLTKLTQTLTSQKIPALISKLESFESWIINSNDLKQELHRNGISLGFLPHIYQQTSLPFLKKVILSELTKITFLQILRSQLNSVYCSFPAKQFEEELTLEEVDKIILDCLHILVDQLFSYSSRSQNIWRLIVKQVNKKYRVVVSKEDILVGYLLGGIMSGIGIQADYKMEQFDRKQPFFVRQNTIPRQLLLHFTPKLRRYTLTPLTPSLSRLSQILSLQPSPQNFQQLSHILSLKNHDIPSYLQPIRPDIITYLCNFIPLGDDDEYAHIGLYEMLEQEPHTYCTTKVSLLGIKWAAKKRNQELANKIFQIKQEENCFWVSEFNPAISEYYDFFSLYNTTLNNHAESIKLSKSSLVNTIKLTNPNSLPVADKHYQLGNIYFKIGKKQEALKQYLKTKNILESHKEVSIPQYGVILLKLGLLYLNFGKISDCVGSCLEALKIFDSNGGNQQEEIQTFQILARSYEITRKTGDLMSVAALCSQKFNQTQIPKTFERMLKISLLPKLSTISHEDTKILLKLVQKIEDLQSPISQLDCFNYLQTRAQNQIIVKKFNYYVENITNLYEDIKRKDLFRKHRALTFERAGTQASDMIVLVEAVVGVVGFNFINGALKESYS